MKILAPSLARASSPEEMCISPWVIELDVVLGKWTILLRGALEYLRSYPVQKANSLNFRQRLLETSSK
jgi:hypothetical protein